ncbi:MAG: sigma-70 family RNA polymerase sigma factor [Deltaproteobacteria bacterium]|nr:sigma-70 family RNA polymerase sigma factor [Deltaproteobacteria bacterium]
MSRQTAIGPEGDLAIVAAVRATDSRRALDMLAERFQKEIARFCYHLLRDQHDAADATQETFVAVLEAIEGFRGESSLRTWIFGIARRRCIDRLRKQTRRKTDATDAMDQHADPGTLQDARLERCQNASMLHRLLGELPDIDQSILLMRFDHGLSFQEIGEALGIRADNAKVRAHRALQKLRPMLERRGLGA